MTDLYFLSFNALLRASKVENPQLDNYQNINVYDNSLPPKICNKYKAILLQLC